MERNSHNFWTASQISGFSFLSLPHYVNLTTDASIQQGEAKSKKRRAKRITDHKGRARKKEQTQLLDGSTDFEIFFSFHPKPKPKTKPSASKVLKGLQSKRKDRKQSQLLGSYTDFGTFSCLTPTLYGHVCTTRGRKPKKLSSLFDSQVQGFGDFAIFFSFIRVSSQISGFSFNSFRIFFPSLA